MQAAVAAALAKSPPDRDEALKIVRNMHSQLLFPLREHCGETLLSYAAEWGDLELLQTLLANGAGVDDRLLPPADLDRKYRGCWGRTALMASAWQSVEVHDDQKIDAGLRAADSAVTRI